MTIAILESRRVAGWLLLVGWLVPAAATAQALPVTEQYRLDASLELTWQQASPRPSTVMVANRIFLDGPRISSVRLGLVDSATAWGTTIMLHAFEIVSEDPLLDTPTTCHDDPVITVPLSETPIKATITEDDRVIAGSVWIGVPEVTEIWKRVEIIPPWKITAPTPLLVGYEVALVDITASRITPQSDYANGPDASFVSLDGGATWRCFAGTLSEPNDPDEPPCDVCGTAYARVRVEVEEPEE